MGDADNGFKWLVTIVRDLFWGGVKLRPLTSMMMPACFVPLCSPLPSGLVVALSCVQDGEGGTTERDRETETETETERQRETQRERQRQRL